MTAKPNRWPVSEAPRLEPLTYPGEWPAHSVLLTRTGHHWLEPHDDVDQLLVQMDVAGLGDRCPVLAVGSNASPAQMRHKFGQKGVSLVIPMLKADVYGLDVGFAAEVSSLGYIPATPIAAPELQCGLFIQWLDPHQLEALDATEPGYARVFVPASDPAAGGVRLELESGEVLGGAYAYLSTAGCLLGRTEPLRLWDQDQTTLLGNLLRASPRLRELFGPTPTSWIDRVTHSDPNERARLLSKARRIMREAGWVGSQPTLERLANTRYRAD